jgi:SAM-dependent methyltransferase
VTHPGSATFSPFVAEPNASSLQQRVDEIAWYHTFDLPGGIVTPGIYDHRKVAKKVPFPDLTGKRCLDVASSDGFWAFEMARRGAAEVFSVDLADATRQDWQGVLGRPQHSEGSGRAAEAFGIVKEATGLDVQRRDGSVYELSPDELGTFDFVFMGNVMLHLSDPGRALRAVRSVTGGQFLSYEMIMLWLTIVRPRTPRGQLWHTDDARWWTPNMAAHRRLVEAAGFEIEQAGGPLFQPFGTRLPSWPPLRGLELRTHGVRAVAGYWLGLRRFGVPTSWVISHPA